MDEKDKRKGYIYDPYVKGYDQTFWKTISGTPTTSSNRLRLNAARCTSYLLHRYGRLDMSINIPTTPSSGEAKVFGFRNPKAPTLGSAYFEITGATFRAVTYDDEGNSSTTNITWVSGWENAQTVYSIIWERDKVHFMVGGTTYATHAEPSQNVGTNVQMVDLDNSNDSDNCDLDYVQMRNVGTLV